MSSPAIHRNLISLPQELFFEISNWLPEKDVLGGLMKTCRLFKQTFPDGTYLRYLVYSKRLNTGSPLSWGISCHDFRSEMMQRREALAPHLEHFIKGRCIWLVRMAVTSQRMNVILRGNGVMAAAKRGQLSMLKVLLANGKIGKGERGQAVCDAAQKGDLSCIHELLISGSISERDRGQAVLFAATGGHLSCLRELLANGSISRLHRFQSIRSAAINGHFSCIKVLLKDFGPIDDENREIFVNDAAKGGHLACLKELLEGLSERPRWLVRVIKEVREKAPAEIVAYLEAWKPEEKKS